MPFTINKALLYHKLLFELLFWRIFKWLILFSKSSRKGFSFCCFRCKIKAQVFIRQLFYSNFKLYFILWMVFILNEKNIPLKNFLNIQTVAFSICNRITTGLYFLSLDWIINFCRQLNVGKTNPVKTRLLFENATISCISIFTPNKDEITRINRKNETLNEFIKFFLIFFCIFTRNIL